MASLSQGSREDCRGPCPESWAVGGASSPPSCSFLPGLWHVCLSPRPMCPLISFDRLDHGLCVRHSSITRGYLRPERFPCAFQNQIIILFLFHYGLFLCSFLSVFVPSLHSSLLLTQPSSSDPPTARLGGAAQARWAPRSGPVWSPEAVGHRPWPYLR